MPMRLLIANRGEIAIRIARTAAELGIATVGVYAEDDARALHVRHVDEAAPLNGSGAGAYLDQAALIAIAAERGCDAVHPGYGFLSENADFAEACGEAGLTFVGPSPVSLRTFGDKAAARALAQACGVPTPQGISRAVTLPEAQAFLESLGPGAGVMLKALAGGGGRGMRPVTRGEDLPAAFERCASEARSAFGSGDLYVEALIPRARHIEVQILGDGREVRHLWDRECSLQRQRQKIIEIAPAWGLARDVRAAMLDAARRLGAATQYSGVGTVEFLVDPREDAAQSFVFIEANARLQVEHTVTEAVTGLDLVAAQLRLADGASLESLGLLEPPPARGVAVQARVNLETIGPDGTVRPSGGTITAYEPPTGPGVRVDGCGFVGYTASPRYDSLLAKVIVHAPDLAAAAAKTDRALSEFNITGPRTNLPLLRALLRSPAVREGEASTTYVEDHLADLLAAAPEDVRYLAPERETRTAGVRVDPNDPLAVLDLKPRAAEPAAAAPEPAHAEGPDGTLAVRAPLQGLIISIAVAENESVRKGQPLAVMEALKMEHVISAQVAGIVREVALAVGDAIYEDTPILFIEPAAVEGGDYVGEQAVDLDEIRPDLAEILRFHHLTTDEARVDATARRHRGGKRTARENIADLCDPDSFVEYGPLVTAGRRRSDTVEEMEQRVLKTAADGMVIGVGRVNGEVVGRENARCAVVCYDYTVLAGTQGVKNHQKTDRMLKVAEKYRLPVVLFSEGGGGRTSGGGPPAEASRGGILNVATWRELGKLSGLTPLVGINSGYCFAGNVVLLGACDVIIATRDSSIGIGGPAVIEGGGLGAYAPGEVGPVSIQEPNGVIDILVEDEVEATAVAKRYLSYFQGRTRVWEAHDQRILRQIVPQNRRAVYDLRKVIETLADVGSVLELRPRFGVSMLTALIRIEGRPVGVIANNSNSPTGGAIDSDGADKASRFMQLCDAFDIPMLSLVDTPGNMVGPEAEKTALIRHCGRMYVAGANVSVPFFTVVLRKSYGLGALAMSVGSFDETFFTVSWPTGEFAGMGLEGAVKLGRRAELLALTDLAARKARYDELVGEAYAWARALNAGMTMEVDDVIDPATTRAWIAMGLEMAPPPIPRAGKKRAWIDTW
jgi:acetyl/propionyl-CoA carboxylase alpha subunit/acetyl-CoA carboxylase carboxyltransferase component